MRVPVALAALALAAPLSAFAQLNLHYELNEEGPATAQSLTLEHGSPAVLKAAPGEALTAVDLPAAGNIAVEKRYWYSAEVNWNEQGVPLGYRRAGKWLPVSTDKRHRVQLGYDTGMPPDFDSAYWKKARTSFVEHSKSSHWTEVASKCAGPTDAGSWGNADGAYCNVSADAIELRFIEKHKGRSETYQLTYMLSRGR